MLFFRSPKPLPPLQCVNYPQPNPLTPSVFFQTESSSQRAKMPTVLITTPPPTSFALLQLLWKTPTAISIGNSVSKLAAPLKMLSFSTLRSAQTLLTSTSHIAPNHLTLLKLSSAPNMVSSSTRQLEKSKLVIQLDNFSLLLALSRLKLLLAQNNLHHLTLLSSQRSSDRSLDNN